MTCFLKYMLVMEYPRIGGRMYWDPQTDRGQPRAKLGLESLVVSFRYQNLFA